MYPVVSIEYTQHSDKHKVKLSISFFMIGVDELRQNIKDN